MLVDSALELLDPEECRRLRAGGSRRPGRPDDRRALPAIFRVNYAVIDGDVVSRAAPGSKLAAAVNGAVVAFEVDDDDSADRTGWSVLVIGQAEVAHDIDTTCKVLDGGLEPWAAGVRSSIVRVQVDLVSGRRIVGDDVDAPAG